MKSKPAFFRFLYTKQGGHYHVRVFTAADPNQTFAKNGDLVFDEAEWASVHAKLSRIADSIDDDTFYQEAHS